MFVSLEGDSRAFSEHVKTETLNALGVMSVKETTLSSPSTRGIWVKRFRSGSELDSMNRDVTLNQEINWGASSLFRVWKGSDLSSSWELSLLAGGVSD